jgi:hypothetical protein
MAAMKQSDDTDKLLTETITQFNQQITQQKIREGKVL